MNNAIYLAKLITNAYPESMRLLYQSYGIQAPVSASSFIDAYLVHGNAFLVKAFSSAWDNMKASKFSGVDGLDASLEYDALAAYQQQNLDALSSVADEAQKTSWLDSVLGAFSNVANTAGSVFGTYAGIKSYLDGDTTSLSQTDAQTALQYQAYQAQLAQKQAESQSQMKTWLLVGVGVIVVALLVIMYLKKK